MNSFIRHALSLSLLLLTSSAFAASWGSPVTITGYYVYSSGSAYIRTSSSQNPDACSSTNYLYLDTGQPFFKELYATAMLAQTNGSSVSLYYDGCVGSYPRISAIAVPNSW